MLYELKTNKPGNDSWARKANRMNNKPDNIDKNNKKNSKKNNNSNNAENIFKEDLELCGKFNKE
jgi:hypothetical protein